MRLALRRLKNEPVFGVVFSLFVACAVFLIAWPILRVIFYPSLGDYLAFPRNARFLAAFRNSLAMMALSALTCSAVAFMFAYGIVRLKLPMKGLFRFVTLLPVVSPPFIVALSYILLFGTQGMVTKHILGVRLDIYGWHGLWAVQTVSFFPYAYAVIEGVMRNIPENLEHAAGNLGAGSRRIFWDVFFPLCRPGMAGGAMMAAISVLADFGNPSMIAGDFRLLPIEAYMRMVGWYDVKGAAVLSTALLVPTFGIFLFNRHWLGNATRETITGKQSAMPPRAVPRVLKWTVFAGCLSVSLFVLVVYGVLFAGGFAKTWGHDWTPVLSNYAYVWQKRSLILNSLKFAVVSSLLAVMAGFALAWLAERGNSKTEKILDFAAVLPGAVPGIFLGLGFAIALGPAPFSLAGTSSIMILALAIWNVPTCYNADRATLRQIGGSVERAARNLGASSFRIILEIYAPTLKKTLLSGAMLAFLRSMTCLSVVIFIHGATTTVSTVSVLSLVNGGNWSGAAALTTTIMAVAFLGMGLFKIPELISNRHRK
ncbi:MAG: iron ABC transporter permease [Deltaproteobacteria bacterium]|jgi:iron(III) transport system permease protein|nr:iron ABC transporter permease [Deltaproteobacteria bacterium]